MNRFEGEVASITGGASGLGAATAQRFADEGAKVVVADINLEAAKALSCREPGFDGCGPQQMLAAPKRR